MADGRGKSALHCTHSSSIESDGSPNPQPPKKKNSPNNCGKTPLPIDNQGTNNPTQHPHQIHCNTCITKAKGDNPNAQPASDSE